MASRLLEVRRLEASYGAARVLQNVSIDIYAGELVTLLGRNGMGKTTTVRVIMGLLPASSGSIRFKRTAIRGSRPHAIARAGIGLVPEGRQVFPNLTVVENLVATARAGPGRTQQWTMERVFELFPSLVERRGTMASRLSGGEQQMLAVGRALMTNPELLILDEATEGLAPLVRADIWRALAALKQEGLSILVIDKNIQMLTRIADRHHIIEKGRTVWTGTSAALVEDDALRHRYLGV